MALDATAEFERLNALRRYAILDTPPEGAFDRITALAADMLEVPVRGGEPRRHQPGLVQVGARRRRASARSRGCPSLCGAAIGHDGPYVVENASADPRTQEHPLVAGAFGLEFYVGVPLRTHDGHVLGMLCCMDRRPRGVTPQQLRCLETLAAIVMDEIELRRSASADLAALRGAGRCLRRPGAARELRSADRGAGAGGDARPQRDR